VKNWGGYGWPPAERENISGGWHSELGVEPANPPVIPTLYLLLYPVFILTLFYYFRLLVVTVLEVTFFIYDTLKLTNLHLHYITLPSYINISSTEALLCLLFLIFR